MTTNSSGEKDDSSSAGPDPPAACQDNVMTENDSTTTTTTPSTPVTKVESVLKSSPKYSSSSNLVGEASIPSLSPPDSPDAAAASNSTITSPGANTSGLKRRVSFSHVENTSDEFEPIRKGQPRATRSARVGKADPLRDVLIFVGTLAAFYFVSQTLQHVGKATIDDDGGEMVQELGLSGGGSSSGGGGSSSSSSGKKNGGASAGSRSSSLSRLKQMRNVLSMLLEGENAASLDMRRQDDCDLFYAKSSIPYTGLGMFAGRNYSVGEDIMILKAPSMGIEETSTSKLWIVPETLVLKHHPILFNVEPSRSLWTKVDPATTGEKSSTMVLKATQSIVAGQELLLHFNQHLHSVVPDWFDQIIPTLEDYQEADFLIMETRNTFRDPKGPRGRKANQYQQTGMVGQGLRMIQRVVARYRPAVSKLLPIALQSLTEYRGRADQVTSLYLALHNQSSSMLGRYGICLSDVQVVEEKTKPVVNRNVTQGARVHPLPVLVRLKSEGEVACIPPGDDEAEKSCSSGGSSNLCWSRSDALVEFCPLHPLPIADMAWSDNTATVKLQWSNWEEAIDTSEVDLSLVVDKKQRLEKIWILDLVALKDLTEGDELTLQMERDDATGQWTVPKQLIPVKWMIQ